MFEITADDIAQFDDEQLRAVVARLCEGEVRSKGYSASIVTWGGNQNAADGGIDVRVSLPPGSQIDGFLPRSSTGFQVKQQDMPASEITGEMRPKGVLRPSIQALANDGGAYIIVGSEAATSDSVLNSRRNAMRDAVADIPNHDQLFLDFYDRQRVASWIRDHPGLIPWARSLVGRAIPGWRSYGNWSYSSEAEASAYLLDDAVRVYTVGRDSDSGMSASHGIQLIRDELHQPRHVARLVGLSGTGKTRLAEALFDDCISERSLDPALAFYTNVADQPDPRPTELASNLVVSGTRAILVIDNCAPDLHRRLAEIARQAHSNLSVITIEYDVRDDEPEGTGVFVLKPSSSELIERLVRGRFPHVSQVDAHTIAEFSLGNARIAIALAGTVDQNETIGGLNDEELFQRLFHQRHAHDESLYRAAQACALVYSFQGEDSSENEDAELIRLGNLVSLTPQQMYGHVAELKRRDLVQQRGVWRAVLPHAIANRLAATALQNIPPSEVDKQLVSLAPERLLCSFSRRLGYLHSSKEAVRIVRTWLGKDGLLANVAGLNDLGKAMFKNVAPTSPEDTLAALERSILRPNGSEAARNCAEYSNILQSLAHEAAFFDRVAELLARIAMAEGINPQSRTTQMFGALFHMILSGTHAFVEQRVAFAQRMLASPEEKRRVLGVQALGGLLEAWHFNSFSDFDFGARSRDYGFQPRNREDVRHWFGRALGLAEAIGCGDGPAANCVRLALAEKFRGLWSQSGSCEEIARVCRAFGNDAFWREGWLAVRHTLSFDGKGMEPDRLALLNDVEQFLRPSDLVSRVRSVVLSRRGSNIDFDDFDSEDAENFAVRAARIDDLARELGSAVANDEAALSELLPEIVSSDGRLWQFGQGLVLSAGDAETLWSRLVAAVAAVDKNSPRGLVLRGFLKQLRVEEPELSHILLNDAVTNPVLSEWYPYLQAAVDLDARDIARLKRSVELGKAPASNYAYLRFGRTIENIPAPDLRDLALAIAALPDGHAFALEILDARVSMANEKPGEIEPELENLGCELMRQLAFTERSEHGDYQSDQIARSCLKGETGAEVVTEMCQRLKVGVANHEAYAFYYDDLLVGLFTIQPTAMLDGLCGGDEDSLRLGIKILNDVGIRRHPLRGVPDEELLSWCDQDPVLRYPAMADIVTASERTNKEPPHWKNVGLQFLNRSPNPAVILRKFVSQFAPVGGPVGGRAEVLESNIILLDQLEAFPALSLTIEEQRQKVREWIDWERNQTTTWDRDRAERFE